MKRAAPRSLVWFGVVGIAACAASDPPQGDTDTASGTGDAGSDASTAMTTSTSTTSSSTGTGATTSGADATTAEVTGEADVSSGSEGGPAVPVGCFDYDAFEATTVGFRADVMPIFAASCASCHMDADASVYFGLGGTTEAEATAVHAKLLDGLSKQAPHLAFVAPGDPLHSYMLAKIEYPDPGGTCSEVQCDEPGCELPAPPAGPLSEADKAVLRSWVIGGALDD